MLPIAYQNSELGVRITFPDASTQRVFSDYGQLEARFGKNLASKIATRLAALAAARNLGRIPRRPPIGLRPLGAPGHYAVDLPPGHRLRLSAVNGNGVANEGRQDDVDGGQIEEIEVLGVDSCAVTAIPDPSS